MTPRGTPAFAGGECVGRREDRGDLGSRVTLGRDSTGPLGGKISGGEEVLQPVEASDAGLARERSVRAAVQ